MKNTQHRLNEVRIIGGRWRGRKIIFPNLPTLRPTPNRVRETLFNWLAPYIKNAICLDMFGGSGSLSFEALSRGAAAATLWETNKQAITALMENVRRFNTDQLEIKHLCFPEHLITYDSESCFDIVFLDPPFHKGYIEQATRWLSESNCLHKNALIYIEAEPILYPLPLPKNWKLLKEKKAGEVSFYLATRVAY